MKTQLRGDRWAIGLVARTAAGVESEPTEAPTLKLWDSGGTKVVDEKIPKTNTRTRFSFFRLLDLAADRYIGTIEYTIGSTLEVRPLVLDINSAGDAQGAIRAVHEYLSGGVDRWIMETDSGNLTVGRLPR